MKTAKFFMAFIAAALLASLLFPNRKNLARLTVWTREPEKKP